LVGGAPLRALSARPRDEPTPTGCLPLEGIHELSVVAISWLLIECVIVIVESQTRRFQPPSITPADVIFLYKATAPEGTNNLSISH